MSDLTKTEIIKLINDEVKKFYDKEFENELVKILKKANGASRKEIVNLIKNAITATHKFMYIRKDIWGNSLK
jgi:hypothetical protein